MKTKTVQKLEVAVYTKLVAGLLEQRYHPTAQELNAPEARQDHNTFDKSLRVVSKVLPNVLKAIAKLPVPVMPGGIDLHPYFEQEGIQKILDEVKAFSVWIGLKFVLDQPVLVAVVDADHHSPEEQIAIAVAFDKAILEMLEYSATMGGYNIGGVQIGGVKMSSTGILLYTFFDPHAAATFEAATQGRCKIMHFWKKTNVVPWVVDVTLNQVRGHHGLPFIVAQLLNKEELAKSLVQ